MFVRFACLQTWLLLVYGWLWHQVGSVFVSIITYLVKNGQPLLPALFEHDADGSPDIGVFAPDLVFNVAQIGEVSVFWIVDVQHKGWRVTPHLGTVVDTQRSARP